MQRQPFLRRGLLAALVVTLALGQPRCNDKSPPPEDEGGSSFEGASIPQPSVADFELTPDGRRFVGGALFVIGEGAQAAVASLGGTVAGEIPNLNVVYATFEVTGDDELAQIEAAMVSQTGVEATTRDWADLRPAEERELSDSEKLEPTVQVKTGSQANSPKVNLGGEGLWAYETINLFRAWDAIHKANPVTTPVRVAVVDDRITDADPLYFVLADRADFRPVFDYAAAEGQHAHRVASIIGAPNDGKGMTGILAGLDCIEFDLVSAAVVGVIDDTGSYDYATSVSVIVSGLIWAIQSDARVVNMSLSGESTDAGTAKLYELIFRAAPDVLFVAAAGNEGGDAGLQQPASVVLNGVENLVSVAAIDRSGQPAAWYGDEKTSIAETPGSVTIAAPGTDVLATAPTGELEYFAGTSAAAPVVSGVAALMFAVDPDLTGALVRQKLVSSAQTGYSQDISGRVVDAEAAINSVIADVPSLFLGEGTCRTERDAPNGPCDGDNKQCEPGLLVSTCAPGEVCDDQCNCIDPGLPKSCTADCVDDGDCPSSGGFSHCLHGKCAFGTCGSDADCADITGAGPICSRRGNKTKCVFPCSSHGDCPDEPLDQACVRDSDGLKHCIYVMEICSDCPDGFVCDGGSGVCQCPSAEVCVNDLPCQ